MKWLADHGGPACKSWDELYNWSVTEIDAFWESLWRFADIKHSRSFDAVRSGDEIWKTDWFPGARLNFAENLLRYSDDRTAIVSYAEGREPVRLTYGELQDKVAACAAGLKALGVGPGDRVAAMIPNIPEAVIAMLATTSLGAIWSSCSPDFGFGGVLDRFGQIRPKVLISADGYRYAGKEISSLGRIARVAEELPDLERVIIVGHLGKPSLKSVPKSMLWTELLAVESSDLAFEQLPFDHPVYIMYSSGTTGKPKCLVHGAGGTLIQHAKEHLLHTDLRRDDVITYFTTCGWMMWNWLVSALATGSTVLLYEGSPAHPSLSVLWSAIEEEGITVFGTSPKFLTNCEDRDLIPRDKFDLSSLRTILSTGAPLSVANFEYVYQSVKDDIQLASISGGTDIISCFMLGNPLLPVYPGEIQSRGLGMKVEVFNDSGKAVTDEVGELVCTAPFPSRPVSFWNDPDRAKYRAAYFDVYPGVWRHGDYIRIMPHGGIVVYGRSDATLNPGGVRIGTAEIYGPVEAMEEIVDSMAVGQEWKGDVRVILFVVTAERVSLDDNLRAKIRETIRSQRTPRHVPAKILAVPAIPHTLNGKKVELAVTSIIHGREATNRDALANPEALDYFRDLPELTQP
jgi:acetoacetyl-CoA synthetase